MDTFATQIQLIRCQIQGVIVPVISSRSFKARTSYLYELLNDLHDY